MRLNRPLILFFVALLSCQKEEPINKVPDSWQNMIPGGYEGTLEIFYEDQPLYMEDISVEVGRADHYYTFTLDSKLKLSIESIDLYARRIEDSDPNRGIIYIDLKENQYYETQEVGAYRNSIELNLSEERTVNQPHVEIRLSLVCICEANIRHIFIRLKKQQ